MFPSEMVMISDIADTDPVVISDSEQLTTHTEESNSHSKRQSTKCCACDVAKYEVTLFGNWSRQTHPKDFPSQQFGK